MIKYYNVAEEVAKSHLAERERSVRVLIWLREVSPLVIRKERLWVQVTLPLLIRLRRVFALRCNEGASFCRAPNLGGTTIIRPEDVGFLHPRTFFFEA